MCGDEEEEDDDDFEDLNKLRAQNKTIDELKDRPKTFSFSLVEYNPGKDASLDQYLNEFKIFSLVNEGNQKYLIIRISKCSKGRIEEELPKDSRHIYIYMYLDMCINNSIN